MEEYISLGLRNNRYNQIFLFVFSFLIIGANYIIGSSPAFWLLLLVMIGIINLIYYVFSDIKYNSNTFIIEKLFFKKTIPSTNFVAVKKHLFNIYILKFTDGRFYYFGDLKSFFDNTSDINERIKAGLAKPN